MISTFIKINYKEPLWKNALVKKANQLLFLQINIPPT